VTSTAEIPADLAAALADRYMLSRVLGRGGMATVYLADDKKHHRAVALKVLLPGLAAFLGVERFLKEIQIAAQLTHPHILALHDSGEAAGFLYYVMPYCEGASLRQQLEQRRPRSRQEALAIADPVAGALSYAHRMGVLHRDIKPENILFSHGHPIVADFGIAKAVSTAGGANLTRTGFPVGTPGYMSPEQAAGLTELDERTARRRYDRSEVQEIVKRATELEAGAQTAGGTMTIGGVEALAGEVGVAPELVRAAANEVRVPSATYAPPGALPPNRKNNWVAGPTELLFERIVEGELPESEYATRRRDPSSDPKSGTRQPVRPLVFLDRGAGASRSSRPRDRGLGEPWSDAHYDPGKPESARRCGVRWDRGRHGRRWDRPDHRRRRRRIPSRRPCRRGDHPRLAGSHIPHGSHRVQPHHQEARPRAGRLSESTCDAGERIGGRVLRSFRSVKT